MLKNTDKETSEMTSKTDAYGRRMDPRDASYIRRANAQLSRNHSKGRHQRAATWGCPEQECIERCSHLISR